MEIVIEGVCVELSAQVLFFIYDIVLFILEHLDLFEVLTVIEEDLLWETFD